MSSQDVDPRVGDNKCETLRDFFEKFGRELGLEQNHPNENVNITMDSGNVIFTTESEQPYYIDQMNLSVDELLILKTALNSVPQGEGLVLNTKLIQKMDMYSELSPEQEEELLKDPKALANSTEIPEPYSAEAPVPEVSLLGDKDKMEIEELGQQDQNVHKADFEMGVEGVKRAESWTQTIPSRCKDDLSCENNSDSTVSKPIVKDIVKVYTPYKLINYTRTNKSDSPSAERASLFVKEVKRNCDAASGKLLEMSGVYNENISRQNDQLTRALSEQRTQYEQLLQNQLQAQDKRVNEQLRQQREEFRLFMSELRTTMGVPSPASTASSGQDKADAPDLASKKTAMGGQSATVAMTSSPQQRVNVDALAETRPRENQVTGDLVSRNFVTVDQLNTLLDDKLKQSLNDSKNNSSLKSVSEEIKLTLSTKGEGVKRDYKLTDELNFEHFYDFFTMELRTNNLLHIVKPESQEGVNLDQSLIEKQKFRVRDILINRISTKYYEMVSDITDPIEILNKLREMKECEINVDSMSLRTQLFSMIYRPQKQKAVEFITQFENVVRKFNHLARNEKEKLKETEKRDFMYKAVMANVPSIQGLEFWTKNQTGNRMTYREIKDFIMQAELNRQAMGVVGGAMVAQPQGGTHVARNCPERRDNGRGKFKTNPYNNRGRGFGRYNDLNYNRFNSNNRGGKGGKGGFSFRGGFKRKGDNNYRGGFSKRGRFPNNKNQNSNQNYNQSSNQDSNDKNKPNQQNKNNNSAKQNRNNKGENHEETGESVQTEGAQQPKRKRGRPRGPVGKKQKVCSANNAQIIQSQACSSRKFDEISRASLLNNQVFVLLLHQQDASS
ncbi:hypothetical protein QAD02_010394 [Eretmocerus hayati]|uniref:Uncharacterized protein n=1 Tax=Eretmocerus hayati TaxID=131215 RepID=A0ACC2NCU2_9HYME|nr:hypothetical protein QAD02_010394 [Eretmocerus hayati]